MLLCIFRQRFIIVWLIIILYVVALIKPLFCNACEGWFWWGWQWSGAEQACTTVTQLWRLGKQTKSADYSQRSAVTQSWSCTVSAASHYTTCVLVGWIGLFTGTGPQLQDNGWCIWKVTSWSNKGYGLQRFVLCWYASYICLVCLMLLEFMFQLTALSTKQELCKFLIFRLIERQLGKHSCAGK